MDLSSGNKRYVRGLKVIKSSDLESIKDRFCGCLKVLPGIGVVADRLTGTVGHFHSKCDATYMVLTGTIKIALYVPGEQVREITVEKHGIILIPAGVRHKVLAGSHDNSVLMTYSSEYVPGDEVLCEFLEEVYGINLAEAYFSRGNF